MPIAQGRDGIVVALLAHHQLREQHVALGVDARIDLVRHLAQGAFGLLEVAALIPNLAQIEPGPVAHRFGGVLLQQRLEDPARLHMLAQRQIQAAQQQFRLALGVRNAVELRGPPAAV